MMANGSMGKSLFGILAGRPSGLTVATDSAEHVMGLHAQGVWPKERAMPAGH